MTTNAQRVAAYRKRHPIRAAASYAANKAAHPKYHAFKQHKNNAKQRGIPFLFTRQEWIDWWGCCFHLRGANLTGAELVMARNGDEGAYEPSNVHMLTHSQNISDQRRT